MPLNSSKRKDILSYKNKLKFLSDENIPIEIDKLLREKGHDIKKIPLGSTDKQLSEIAKTDSRIILTFDKHFLSKKLFPPTEHHGINHGIIIFKINPPIIDTIFSLLTKLLEEAEQSEFKGRLFIISLFRPVSF